MIEIVSHAIDVNAVVQSVQHPSAGGIAVFIGATRDHAHGKNVVGLEYEAYKPMALREIEKIIERARSRWQLQGVSIIHRIGNVPVGEASVVIAASSTHRTEAFEACRFMIDTLKQEVPIWKKERYADGEVWIGQEGKPLQKYNPP